MSALDELKRAYAERKEAGRAWKAAGGRVVAYLDHTTPQELIEAAGFMAYRITGDPGIPPTSLEDYLFPIWRKASLANRQVKMGWSNSMLDALFTDRFEFVDHLVIAYSRKNFLAFWEQLTDAKKHHPHLRIPELHILDRAITPFFLSSAYNRTSILLMKAQLEAWSGQPITDAALSKAIVARETTRDLLARVQALRTADEPKVSGSEALQLMGATHFMPAERANQLLAAALPELEARKGRRGLRVFVAGSPLDHAQLYDAIEADGATVVGEDSFWGQRMLDHPHRTDVEPLEAIAHRYHSQPAGVEFPLEKAIEGCVARAEACRAKAGVFYVYAFDNHQLWDVPDAQRGLEAAGIRTHYFQEQPYAVREPQRITAAVRRLADVTTEEFA